MGFPKLKGAKKLAGLRRRKEYGSKGARYVPTRYPVYDKLEEYDETLPWYTVISEPEDPQKSYRDAPLLNRYPWAEPFKTPEKKQEAEANPHKALEPYFGNFIHDVPPPLTRTQLYIERRGFPTYQYPPWINKPKFGTKWPDVWKKLKKHKTGDLAFHKDRRSPEKKIQDKLEATEMLGEGVMGKLEAPEDDGIDDLDDVLDALDE